MDLNFDQKDIDTDDIDYNPNLGLMDRRPSSKNTQPFTDYVEELDSSEPTITTGVSADLKNPTNDYTDLAKVRGEIPDKKYSFVNPNLNEPATTV